VTDLLGPLSEGRVLVTLAVLLGVGFVALAAAVARVANVPVPDTPVLALVGIAAGFGVMFAAHAAWHARS